MLTLPTDSTNTEYLIRPTLAMQIGTARAWAEAMKALGAQIANDRADLLIVPVVDIEAEKLALIRTLRDETQSNDIYVRCVAIVGER